MFLSSSDVDLDEYMTTFVQSGPRYGIKEHGREWRSVEGTITRDLVYSHLRGKFSVASLGRWYPVFGAIDIDTVPSSGVDSIRLAFGLNATNSMLFTSETANHHHILFRPVFNENPPTLRLFRDILEPYGKFLGVEIYPQENRTFRLPFGPMQVCEDYGRELLDWRQAVYWFQKLDTLSLESLPRLSLPFLSYIGSKCIQEGSSAGCDSAYWIGARLLEEGMGPGMSRTTSQFHVLYYLWRNGLTEKCAVLQTKSWIRQKHHGYSKTVNQGIWRVVDADIDRQASRIWKKYHRSSLLPNTAWNGDEGWTTRQDILTIIVTTRGKMRLARFLYNILKYMYPRTLSDTRVPIHSDRLIKMSSSSSYLDFIARLTEMGLIRRGSGYREGIESKNFILHWNYDRESEPFLIDGKNPAGFDEAVLHAYPGAVYLQALRNAGADSKDISSFRRNLGRLREAVQQTYN